MNHILKTNYYWQETPENIEGDPDAPE